MKKGKRRKPTPPQALAAPPRERRAPPPPRFSVEDPLGDWPDDERPADRWLLERIAQDVERGEG